MKSAHATLLKVLFGLLLMGLYFGGLHLQDIGGHVALASAMVEFSTGFGLFLFVFFFLL